MPRRKELGGMRCGKFEMIAVDTTRSYVEVLILSLGQLLFDRTKSYIEISTIASPILWLFVYTSCPLKLLATHRAFQRCSMQLPRMHMSMLTVEISTIVSPVSTCCVNTSRLLELSDATAQLAQSFSLCSSILYSSPKSWTRTWTYGPKM